MKNRLLTGILFIILGALIALGPQTIFPVCGVHTEEQTAVQGAEQADNQGEPMEEAGESAMTAVMACFWTGRAELGIGALIAVLGALLLLFPSRQVRIGLSIALALGGILALLIPTALIGVCGSPHMTCRSLSLPALSILSAMVIALAAVNGIYLYKSDGRGRTEDEAKAPHDRPAGRL